MVMIWKQTLYSAAKVVSSITIHIKENDTPPKKLILRMWGFVPIHTFIITRRKYK